MVSLAYAGLEGKRTVIIARQEYTVAPGKLAEALDWLREVQSWECHRLVYPRGCRVYSTSVGRIDKVVVEAEYSSLLERLACLRYLAHCPECKAWRDRQAQLCLHVYGAYDRPADSRTDQIAGRPWES
jgi:hypothetical protein